MQNPGIIILMSKVENIEDHMTYSCKCGSVHFNLLKSELIECSNCSERFGLWSQTNDLKVIIEQACDDINSAQITKYKSKNT